LPKRQPFRNQRSRCFCCFCRKLSASDMVSLAEILGFQGRGGRKNSRRQRRVDAAIHRKWAEYLHGTADLSALRRAHIRRYPRSEYCAHNMTSSRCQQLNAAESGVGAARAMPERGSLASINLPTQGDALQAAAFPRHAALTPLSRASRPCATVGRCNYPAERRGDFASRRG
jgi:hypothetical protein